MNNQMINHGLPTIGNMIPGNQQHLNPFQAAPNAMHQAYWLNQLAQMGFRPMMDPNALLGQPMMAPPQLMAPQQRQVMAPPLMLAPSPPLPMAMAPAPAVNRLVQIKQEIKEFDPDELQVIRDDLNDENL